MEVVLLDAAADDDDEAGWLAGTFSAPSPAEKVLRRSLSRPLLLMPPPPPPPRLILLLPVGLLVEDDGMLDMIES